MGGWAEWPIAWEERAALSFGAMPVIQGDALDELTDFGLLLVDDHPLLRDGLTLALRTSAPGLRVQAVASPEEAEALVTQDGEAFDLVLLDYRMPGQDGLACAQALRQRHPHMAVGLMSGAEDASLPARARQAGLVAYLPKSLEIDALVMALCRLARGEAVFDLAETVHANGLGGCGPFCLTARQMAVLRLLATGASNKAIAQQMGISPATVKNHLDAIFAKMGASNRLQAVMMVRAATDDAL
jgi:two-component system, NarL family, nitrate/nitrite response regulator NarL